MADRIPVANELWPQAANPAVHGLVLAVRDGRVSVDDPVLGIVCGSLAEFYGIYAEPAEAWRDPSPSTLWAAVMADGSLGPMRPGVEVSELDVESARLAGYPAVVRCDVIPDPETLRVLQ